MAKPKPRKIGVRRRLANTWSWVRHPQILVAVMVIALIFVLSLALPFPCGKGSWPVDGACSDGAPISNPLQIAVWLSFAVGIVFLLIASGGSNDTKWRFNDIPGSIARWYGGTPKWRRRWLPAALVAAYLVIALVAYLETKGAGFHWLHQVGIYVLAVPVWAWVSGLAGWMLTTGRKQVRNKKRR